MRHLTAYALCLLALPLAAIGGAALAQTPSPAPGQIPGQLPGKTPPPAMIAPAQDRPGAETGRLATEAPELRALFEAMGLYAILDIMAAEGIAAGPDVEADLFPGRGGPAWAAIVARLYAADRLTADFEAAVQLDRITPEMLAELADFYATDLGARVAMGEVQARRAFLDPGIEEAAADMAQERAAAGDPRIGQLTEFIRVNDLVERNVSGALNSNFAFYRGLSDAGAFAAPIPEELMLAEVWGQEGEIRSSTTEWLFSYQILAYADLDDAELDAYIAMTATPAGQALNGVLFTAFDMLFDGISHELGREAARFMTGSDI